MEVVAEDAPIQGELDDRADACPSTMLEHPVFVHWCISCGQEAPEDAPQCPRCAGLVRRHQRVLELPDEDPGALSLASLRAALADVSADEDVGSSAVLLSEQGPDPGVAAAYPALARDLAALGVPPAVQRALVNRGFISLEQITAAAASSAPGEGALAVQLGLSPAAEILLRRLWHTAAERRGDEWRAAHRRRPAELRAGSNLESCRGVGDAPLAGLSDMASSSASGDDLDNEEDSAEDPMPWRAAVCEAVSAKRLRMPVGGEEGLGHEGEAAMADDSRPPGGDPASWQQRCDSQMQALEDDGVVQLPS